MEAGENEFPDLIDEMVGVSSDFDAINDKLPEATRAVFAPLHARVRPGSIQKRLLRFSGRLLVRKAIGAPGRETRPFSGN